MTVARRLLVALILAATATFVVGVLLERHQATAEGVESPAQRAAETDRAGRTGESSTTQPPTESSQKAERGERSSGDSSEHGHSGEAGESGGGERHQKTVERTTTTTTTGVASGEPARTEPPAHAESSEELLGINPESTGLLAVAIVVSLLLAAAALWWAVRPTVFGIVVLAMAGFCALDIREVAHQLNESRAGLAILAGVVAALHLGAAVLGARIALAARHTTGPPAAA
jgi:uncharacterized membrane protein YgcG